VKEAGEAIAFRDAERRLVEVAGRRVEMVQLCRGHWKTHQVRHYRLEIPERQATTDIRRLSVSLIGGNPAADQRRLAEEAEFLMTLRPPEIELPEICLPLGPTAS